MDVKELTVAIEAIQMSTWMVGKIPKNPRSPDSMTRVVRLLLPMNDDTTLAKTQNSERELMSCIV